MIVIDASVAVEIFIKSSLGVRHEARVLSTTRHAPHLINLELTQALRRLVSSGAVAIRIAEEALNDFRSAALNLHGHDPLLPRIWALRNSLSAYDASYVALAETLDMPMLTCDAKLSRSHGHNAKIELLT